MPTRTQTVSKVLEDPKTDFERFLYIVSHDLQEPIRTVDGFLRLLELKHSPDLNAEAKELIQHTRNSAEKLKKMVQALTDLSRVGRSTEEAEEVDIAELFQDMKDLYESKFETISIESQTPSIKIRPSQFLKLLRSLIDNAYQHNPDQVKLTLSAISSETGIEMIIKDNGKGVAKKTLDKIPEMFYTLEKHPNRIGAGLAMATEIVKNNNGEMQLLSTENGGLSAVVNWKV